ncbi:unnamed protein product [Ectocarpus sp. 12 AP-2014]
MGSSQSIDTLEAQVRNLQREAKPQKKLLEKLSAEMKTQKQLTGNLHVFACSASDKLFPAYRVPPAHWPPPL